MGCTSSLRLAKGVITNRWMVVVATFFIMACSGATYNYGVYSQEMKLKLQYDQETVNTIGFFKDLGSNVGVFSGLLYDLTGPWVVLSCGAVLNIVGYLMIWLAVTGKTSAPPIWRMCLYICIGANSQAFTNTGVIVTSVKNFPGNRGLVIGLLKGYVGLSGAMLNLFYEALYGSSPSSFILLIAWLPSLVCLTFMFVIRRMPSSEGAKAAEGERKIFMLFLLIALVLAAYLMIIIVVQHLHGVRVPRLGIQLLAVLTLAIVVSPLLLVVRDELRKLRSRAEVGEVEAGTGLRSRAEVGEVDAGTGLRLGAEVGEVEAGTGQVSKGENQLPVKASGEQESAKSGHAEQEKAANTSGTGEQPQEHDRVQEPTISNPGRQGDDGSSVSKQGNNGPVNHGSEKDGGRVQERAGTLRRFIQVLCRKPPPRGTDYSILEAVFTLDMLIIFIGTTCGVGSGLMAIDNLGQIGDSLGYSHQQVSTFVSLISIWNFLGRVGSGFVSEFALQRYGTPRTLFFSLAIGVAAVGHILIAFNLPGALFVGSILLGLTFGATWALMFTIISELFGLKYYGTLYNVGGVASPLGSYLLSVRVAGALYDREAAKGARKFTMLTRLLLSESQELLCHGTHCYRNTFLIMAAVCIFGCLVSLVLAARTRRYYARLSQTIKQQAVQLAKI